MSKLPIPQITVPHLVGEGGHTIQEAKGHLSITIKIMDGINDQQPGMTLMGLQDKVEVAKVVLGVTPTCVVPQRSTRSPSQGQGMTQRCGTREKE